MDPLDLLGRPPSGQPLSVQARAPMPDQFPGLRAGSHRFDSPGGTLTHAAVRDALAGYLGSEHVANDHGAFAASRVSDGLVAWATDQVRALLGARAGHIVFGPNMTTLTAMFTRSIASRIGEGDEIVCTELDHEANVVPWVALAKSRGASVRIAPLARPGELPARAVLDLVTPRTRWVAVTAASNALGAVTDLPAIIEAAHAVGARVYMDGVQAVAHLPIDIAALGCDAFVASAYKWYGPHAGVLWLADAVAADARLAEQVPSAGDDLPGRLDLGTTNFEAVLGTGVAARVLLEWDRAEIAAREAKLADLLLGLLSANPAVRLFGPSLGTPRVPVVTFQVDGLPAETVARRLAEADISVWHGTFYADAALRALSPDEPDAVRAGIACYTTEDDVLALADAVAGLTLGATARVGHVG